MNNRIGCGAERRAAKRSGVVQAFTRAQAVRMIAQAMTLDECSRWSNHPSKHVKRYAWARALKLSMPIVNTQTPMSEFDILVERFRKEGKPNPAKSARASIAAKAQAAKRKEVQATF